MGDSLKRAKRADFAIAFVSLAGLQKVLPALRRVAMRGGVRIVTGLYQDITEPAALRKLLQIAKEMRDQFSVRISTNQTFHRKLYLLTLESSVKAFIGSSNLSLQGLSSGGELVLALTLPAAAEAVKAIQEEFRIMVQESVPLTRDLIQRYAARHALVRRHGQPKGLPSFAEIIGSREPLRNEDAEDFSRRLWRDSITGYVRTATAHTIGEETDWDRKGWSWYCPGRNSYCRGDRILLFDFTDDRACIVEVADRTECPTPDGRHFLAYRAVRGSRKRKLTPSLWVDLKDHKAISSKADARNSRRLLGISVQNALRTVFRKL